MGKVIVFSTPGCSFCTSAKAILNANNIPFSTIDLHTFPTMWQLMKERSNGKLTVPQIFFQTKYVGGCDNLTQIAEEGKLSELYKEIENEQDDGYWDSVIPSSNSTYNAKVGSSIFFDPALDEIYEIARKSLTASNKLADTNTKKTFTGEELLAWLSSQLSIPLSSAVVTAEKLLSNKYLVAHEAAGEPFDKCNSYLFYQDLAGGLNTKIKFEGTSRSADVVVEEMRMLLEELEANFITNSGRAVNYQEIASSPQFKQYQIAATELQLVNLQGLSYESRLSFFINTYNILMIHGSVAFGAPTNDEERILFFSNVSYLIDSHLFSLNDIEHGILRSNRIEPFSATQRFPNGDPRSKYIMESFDPRIHFALVCGAKSCPPIKIYNPTNVDLALQLAAESYFMSELQVHLERQLIILPRLLQWFSIDFGSTQREVVAFAIKFLSGEKKDQLQSAFQDLDKFTIDFTEYNWEQNSN